MNQRGLLASMRVVVCVLVFSNAAFGYHPQATVWENRSVPLAAHDALPLPAISLSATRLAGMDGKPTNVDGKLTLPLSFGTIRGVLSPSSKSSTVVIHIQDIHRNAEAQRNISSAIQDLVNRTGAQLVGVEGAFASVDVRSLTEQADAASLKIVADTLLASDDISGPLHAALLSPPARFVGVDDESAYWKNRNAYLESQRMASVVRQRLDSDRRKINQDKNIFNKRLADFDSSAEAYAGGTLSLVDYANVLVRIGGDGNSVDGSELHRFVELSRLESHLNFQKVEHERARLLAALSSALDATAQQALLQRAIDVQSGQLSPADFYAGLARLCHRTNISLDAYAPMSDYIRYALEADKLNASKLFREITAAEEKNYTSLAQTDLERNVVARARVARLQEKLFQFSLGPDEWEKLKTLEAQKNIELRPFEDFYRMAELRDDRMAENFLNAIHTSRVPPRVCVLVTGGFHTRGIDERLVRAGLEVISFTPKVTRVDGENGSAYLTSFLREKTPLENLFQHERLFLAGRVGTTLQMIQLAAGVTAEEALRGKINLKEAPLRFLKLASSWLRRTAVQFRLTRVSSDGVEGQIGNDDDRYAEFRWSAQADGSRRFHWSPARLIIGAAILAAILAGIHLFLSAIGSVKMTGIPSAIGPYGVLIALCGGIVSGSSGHRSSSPEEPSQLDAAVEWYTTVYAPAFKKFCDVHRGSAAIPFADLEKFVRDNVTNYSFGLNYKLPPFIEPNAQISFASFNRKFPNSILEQLFLPAGIAIIHFEDEDQVAVVRSSQRHEAIGESPVTSYIVEPSADLARRTGLADMTLRISIYAHSVVVRSDEWSTMKSTYDRIGSSISDAYFQVRARWLIANPAFPAPEAEVEIGKLVQLAHLYEYQCYLTRWMTDDEVFMGGYLCKKETPFYSTFDFTDHKAMNKGVIKDVLGTLRSIQRDRQVALAFLDRLTMPAERRKQEPGVVVFTDEFLKRFGSLDQLQSMRLGPALDAIQAVAADIERDWFWSVEEQKQIVATGKLPTENPVASASHDQSRFYTSKEDAARLAWENKFLPNFLLALFTFLWRLKRRRAGKYDTSRIGRLVF